MSRNKLFIIMIVFLSINSIPYLVGAFNSGDSYVFSGLLLNPYDGYSYIAKLEQGASGSWTFTLPFTSSPGEGTYIYLYHLFLGHLSRWFHIDNVIIYHLFRILGGILLFFSLVRIIKKYLVNTRGAQEKAIILCLFGSGLGWLFFLFIGQTADFWVAETYPLLSTLTNVHFPLTLALILNGFILFDETINVHRGICLVLIGFGLSIISPFGLLLVGIVMSIQSVWRFFEEKEFTWMPIFWVGLGGLPYMIYLLWVNSTNPQIAGWQQQNIMETPGVIDLILSLSPAFIFSLVGVYYLLREKAHPGRRLWLSWFITGGILVFIPFSLQRRLLLGYYIPCAVLGVYGIVSWFKSHPKIINRLYFFVLLLSLPTILLILASVFYAIKTHDQSIYYSTSENEAMSWIKENTSRDSVFLSSPEIGTVIPAVTGRRVLYGHPLETPDADYFFGEVTAYFTNSLSDDEKDQLVKVNNVDYVFLGPRESELGTIDDFLQKYSLVYQNEDVQIFQVEKLNK